MKTLLGIITVVLLGAALTCQAVDYDNHFFDQRVYRVSLGSGNAPTAADMALIRLQNGEMVLNTDDDVLYIMHSTNVYTKIEADGTMTVAALSADQLTAGSTASAINGTSITNLTAANIGAISAASAVTNVIIDTSAGITNTVVLYPFGGVYVVGSWTTTP